MIHINSLSINNDIFLYLKSANNEYVSYKCLYKSVGHKKTLFAIDLVCLKLNYAKRMVKKEEDMTRSFCILLGSTFIKALCASLHIT